MCVRAWSPIRIAISQWPQRKILGPRALSPSQSLAHSHLPPLGPRQTQILGAGHQHLVAGSSLQRRAMRHKGTTPWTHNRRAFVRLIYPHLLSPRWGDVYAFLLRGLANKSATPSLKLARLLIAAWCALHSTLCVPPKGQLFQLHTRSVAPCVLLITPQCS